MVQVEVVSLCDSCNPEIMTVAQITGCETYLAFTDQDGDPPCFGVEILSQAAGRVGERKGVVIAESPGAQRHTHSVRSE